MRLFVVVAMLLGSVPAFAQDQKTLDAAADLVMLMKLDEQIAATVDPLISEQVAANPQLVPVEGVMREFFLKYFTAEEIRPRLTEVYAKHFDVKELKAMTKFYKTPTGKKLLAVEPALTVEAGQVGRQIVLDHQAELMQMVMAKLLENPQ